MAHVNVSTVAVTGTSVTAIVPAASGYIYTLTGLTAVNTAATTNGITIFNGDQSITPPIYLGGSGTYIWDFPGGGNLQMARSSGVGAALTSPGTMSVTAYYTIDDERTPISKEQARAATFANAQTTRNPNWFGDQQLT